MLVQKCLRYGQSKFLKSLAGNSNWRRIFMTPFSTVGEVESCWQKRFEDAGVPEPVDSIRHILAHVIGTTKTMEVVNSREKSLNDEQMEKLDTLCQCRLSRMPVQYIIGNWDFRDLTLKLVPPIFIPRPETEILVDIVLKHVLTTQSSKVLEVGCGSGAISLALAHSSKNKVHCTAIDTNIHACQLAKENADNMKLTEYLNIVHATLTEDATIDKISTVLGNDVKFCESSQFDLIVSNPPYVPTKQVFKLEPEIKIFEDIRALDGGEDGLRLIKPLLKYASKALKPSGQIFIEVDPKHPALIREFVEKSPDLRLQYLHTFKDFCNNERFVELMKSD